MSTANLELRAPASAAMSFRLQMMLLARSGRWFMLLGTLVLILLAVIRTGHGHGPEWGATGFTLSLMIGLPAASIWALGIWAGEFPQRRSYHWSLPVSRPAHDLARVAAGVIYLVAAWVALALAVNGFVVGSNAIAPDAWLAFFAAPVVMYFLTMPLTLWGDSRVVRWIIGFVMAWGIAVILDIPYVGEPLIRLFEAPWGLEAALFGGLIRDADADLPIGSPGAISLWLGIGIAATIFCAIWRPADLARLARKS